MSWSDEERAYTDGSRWWYKVHSRDGCYEVFRYGFIEGERKRDGVFVPQFYPTLQEANKMAPKLA